MEYVLSSTDPIIPAVVAVAGFAEDPVTVKMRPQKPSGQCYWNADAFAEESGGKVRHGWLVMGWEKIYIKLLHHAIVETPESEYIDVTDPGCPCTDTSAFFIDETISAPRDYPAYISNRYYASPVKAAKAASELARMANESQLDALRKITAIQKECGIPWVPGAKLSLLQFGNRASEIMELNKAFEASRHAVDRGTAACRAFEQTH